MNPFTLLALLSVIGAAALFIALAFFLFRIIAALELIGGERKAAYGLPPSFLSRIRLGVRAIEVQTSAIPREVTRLNAGLSAVRDGLVAIDRNLGGVIAAVSRQERP
jgi:hypothetical protein